MEVFVYKLDNFIMPAGQALPGNQPDFDAIRAEFRKTVAGTVYTRTKKHTKKISNLLLYCCGCNKRYKLEFSNTAIEVMHCIAVSSPDDRLCICAPTTPQLRADDRKAVKEQLKLKTPTQLRRELFSQPLSQNSPPPITFNSLKMVLHEMRSDEDLDKKDAINDVILRFRTKQLNNIAEVALYTTDKGERFRMILTTDHAIETLKRYLMNKDIQPFKRLLLDATGKITAPVHGSSALLHHVLLAPIQKQEGDEECWLFPVGEMVTDDQTGKNISHFVNHILDRLSAATRKCLHQIGTDDSWANVHAIISATPGMTVTKFLKLSFDVFRGEEPSKELLDTIAPAYCFSHLSKNWKNDIMAQYGKDASTVRHTVRAALTVITTIADPLLLDWFIRCFIILLGSKHVSQPVEDARKHLAKPNAEDWFLKIKLWFLKIKKQI